MTASTLTWDVARAGGLIAYALLAASVIIGLIVSLKWRSPRWTRFITTELHRFVTLLALVFTAVHTVAVAIDPFIKFALPEVFVPFLSHYRPLWIALGIVGAYLLIAIYASEWIRPRVGYGWWRRFHYLSFFAFALALVHGLGTGSDTRAPWAIVLYATTAVLVAALMIARALPSQGQPAHPIAAAVTAGALILGAAWAWQAPLQSGWNAIANDGHGSGSPALAAAAADPRPSPSATASPSPSPAPAQPFSDTVAGRLSQSADGWVVLSGALRTSGDQLTMRFRLADEGQLSLDGATVTITAPNGDACSGPVQGENADGLLAVCQGSTSGSVWQLRLALSEDPSGAIQGSVEAIPQGG